MTGPARFLALAGAALAAAALAGAAFAQEGASAASAAETAYVFNTFSFLFNGALVMWMAAGFCMLEAGMVRGKSAAAICAKNIGLYSVAGLMYCLIGYNLMYDGVDGGFMGSLGWFDSADPAYAAGDDHAAPADWFFQMVFVATAASIVSGTLAERVKLWPFLIFVGHTGHRAGLSCARAPPRARARVAVFLRGPRARGAERRLASRFRGRDDFRRPRQRPPDRQRGRRRFAHDVGSDARRARGFFRGHRPPPRPRRPRAPAFPPPRR